MAIGEPGSWQLPLGLREGETTVGQVLERIRRDSRDESEKGRWFENLVRRVLLENPEYEVTEVHRWADWPERVEVTGLGGNDIGIDLVAKHADGSWVAIQCKCYAPTVRVGKGHIDSFLASSQIGGTEDGPVFAMRWIVATCPWTKTAEVQIEALAPPVRRIDFLRHGDDAITEEAATRPVREPWPLQAEAIEDVVEGLRNHDRGRLIMACGTGKTFTSLRIAERMVANGGRILFVAPSIALVSQARREWLRHTTRKLDSRVVCSDHTAGGRGESRNDIGLSELECAVTSDAKALAAMLANPLAKRARVIYSTYQSLRHVTEAAVQTRSAGLRSGVDGRSAPHDRRHHGGLEGWGAERFSCHPRRTGAQSVQVHLHDGHPAHLHGIVAHPVEDQGHRDGRHG